jgi:hypothetical protein
VSKGEIKALARKYFFKLVLCSSAHGFVNFSSASEAFEAIRHLNGFKLNGSRLVVEASQELEDFLAANQPKQNGQITHPERQFFIEI